MISFVEGEVVEKTANRVVLNVGGVGYDLQVPTSVWWRCRRSGARRGCTPAWWFGTTR